ncbi:MAG: hypothetical protein ACOX3G_02315 [Armatimonadota bacterium]|jgi:hypothetical protein
MSFSKLKKIHIIIIGSVLCVLVGVAVFFLQIKPQMEALKAAKARYDKAVVKGNEQSKQQAKRDLAKAMMDFSIAQAQLDVQMRKRMPDLDFSRRDIGMLALWNEQIKTLGPLLENFAKDKNVRVSQATFQIQPPPANPNDAVFDQDVLVFPLGSISVEGGFKELMDNIRRWNNCSRLVMVGAPTLAGVSPQLKAVYPLTCYVFPRAKGGSKIVMAGEPDASGMNP